MPNTLGLDDDMDGAELVWRLEELFDVTVSNDEAADLRTVGQFYDLLLEKVPSNADDRKCRSAMAFFRLRRSLQAHGNGDRLTPYSNLRFLERGRTRNSLRMLECETGLHMPKTELTRIGHIAAFVGFAMALAGVFLPNPGLESVVLGVLAGWAVAAIVYKLDPGRLPGNCETLGGLARVVAFENFGRLARMGARHTREDTWQILLEALSSYALPKSEITRETVFLQSQLKGGASH